MSQFDASTATREEFQAFLDKVTNTPEAPKPPLSAGATEAAKVLAAELAPSGRGIASEEELKAYVAEWVATLPAGSTAAAEARATDPRDLLAAATRHAANHAAQHAVKGLVVPDARQLDPLDWFALRSANGWW